MYNVWLHIYIGHLHHKNCGAIVNDYCTEIYMEDKEYLANRDTCSYSPKQIKHMHVSLDHGNCETTKHKFCSCDQYVVQLHCALSINLSHRLHGTEFKGDEMHY